jgi:hypothetical protein
MHNFLIVTYFFTNRKYGCSVKGRKGSGEDKVFIGTQHGLEITGADDSGPRTGENIRLCSNYRVGCGTS